MNWLANMFQNPHKIGEVAIVVRGDKGVGKSIVGEMICELLGKFAIDVNEDQALISSFNYHLRHTIFISANEAAFTSSKRKNNALKGLVTSHTIFIQPKGAERFLVPSRLHVYISSNDDQIIEASLNERRYFALLCSDAKIGNFDYFASIVDEWKAGGKEAFLWEMMNRDISNFNVRDVPVTTELNHQKQLQTDILHTWWQDCLVEGTITDNIEWEDNVDCRNVFENIVDYHRRDRSGAVPITKRKLGIFLNSVTGGKILRAKTNGCLFYQFPTLEYCRKIWEGMYGEVDWEPIQETSNHDEGIPF